ncbi:MAG: chorismate synthase [Clostridia bacterium]
MLRFLTAGESHGKCLTAIIEGLPSGIEISEEYINKNLHRRQLGYGRGGRMKLETDTVEITAGVRHGKTLGSPLCLVIYNRDYENWTDIMSISKSDAIAMKEVTKPRPGHADLAGSIKYRHKDIRNILERASARETAIRVAAGSVALALLESFGIQIRSYVISIGEVSLSGYSVITPEALEIIEASPVRCPDKKAELLMIEAIDAAKAAGDSLGGIFTVVAKNIPIGIGSHVHWDRRLDGNLSRAMMSIPGIKGVEIGAGFDAAKLPGSKIHDGIFYDGSFYRDTNNAGGIEGGISNGEDILISCAMKPIPTLIRPLQSVDIESKEAFPASYERSDVCAVPAASIVGEAAASLELAAAFIDKFGGDSLEEMLGNYNNYLTYIRGV